MNVKGLINKIKNSFYINDKKTNVARISKLRIIIGIFIILFLFLFILGGIAGMYPFLNLTEETDGCNMTIEHNETNYLVEGYVNKYDKVVISSPELGLKEENIPLNGNNFNYMMNIPLNVSKVNVTIKASGEGEETISWIIKRNKVEPKEENKKNDNTVKQTDSKSESTPKNLIVVSPESLEDVTTFKEGDLAYDEGYVMAIQVDKKVYYFDKEMSHNLYIYLEATEKSKPFKITYTTKKVGLNDNALVITDIYTYNNIKV